MTQQTLNNGESGSVIRGKINANFTELYSAAAIWGSISGTLSAQTDLQNALNAKQATLVSGTNIKTINGTSVLGSGDLTVSGSGGTWGSITGTLSSQTDLQAAIDAKLNASGGTLTGSWDLRGGYGTGGIRAFASGGLGLAGIGVYNYFGTLCGTISGSNTGNMIISSSATPGATNSLGISAGVLTYSRFEAIDTNGGGVSSPLFVLDSSLSHEGGFYCPKTGVTATVQYWVSDRQDRVSLLRDGTLSILSGKFILTGLPTSASGLATGSVWNDSGVLKIV